jgi:hypothetical protein
VRELASEEIRRKAGAPDYLNMDIHSQVDVDALGQLIALESRVDFASSSDKASAKNTLLRVVGTVNDRQLSLTTTLVETIKLSNNPISLAENSILPETLSPPGTMPKLRLNQEWTVQVFNPFNPLSAVEIVQAKVVREDFLIWNNQPCSVLVVEYRQSDVTNSAHPSGQTWVRNDGVVLRQQVQLFTQRLNFVRRPPRPAPAAQAGFDDHD